MRGRELKGFLCFSFCFRSTSLKLDGVRRVWGKDGYLVKREPVEEAGQVEVPNLHLSPSPKEGAAVSPTQSPASKPTPEPEPEKQQLASSLFVGLASHSSVSLVRFLCSEHNEVKDFPDTILIHSVFFEQMGKTEDNPHRFRRKAKAPDLSREGLSNSAFSSSTSVDNFLCDNLLDPASAVASPSQASRLPLSPSATDNDVALRTSSPVADDGVGGETEPALPTDACLSSHVPVELRGLPRSDIAPLSSNRSLELSACHVQKDDALVLLLFIHNRSSSDLQRMQLELHSDQLEVTSVTTARRPRAPN